MWRLPFERTSVFSLRFEERVKLVVLAVRNRVVAAFGEHPAHAHGQRIGIFFGNRDLACMLGAAIGREGEGGSSSVCGSVPRPSNTQSVDMWMRGDAGLAGELRQHAQSRLV